jgi:hypothetical protein
MYARNGVLIEDNAQIIAATLNNAPFITNYTFNLIIHFLLSIITWCTVSLLTNACLVISVSSAMPASITVL